MNFRLDWRGWRFYIALTHSKLVSGVNSKLQNGQHFLMWDFDDVEEVIVREVLANVQKRFKLSAIYLINTGLPNYWHAYCFTKKEWGEVLLILSSTPHLDPVFFKIGCIRGYFTLRYSPKKGRDFKPAIVLGSNHKADVNPFELSNFVKYWTKRV